MSEQQLATGAWTTVDQATIERFADATGDHQWIHVDRERAAASPLGGTVAHGYLTLSLLPRLLDDVLEIRGRDNDSQLRSRSPAFPDPPA